MIRGNESAIDLGLEILLAIEPNQPHDQIVLAAFCETARQFLKLPTQPIRQNDIFYIEQKAFKKMRCHARKVRSGA